MALPICQTIKEVKDLEWALYVGSVRLTVGEFIGITFHPSSGETPSIGIFRVILSSSNSNSSSAPAIAAGLLG